MDDKELKAALASFGLGNIPINNSTRPVLERKLDQLRKKQSTEDKKLSTENNFTEETVPTSPTATSYPSPPEYLLHDHPLATKDGFYALAIDTASLNLAQREHIQHIYTSKESALRAIKLVSGARFKKFSTENAALSFKDQQVSELNRRIGERKTCIITTSNNHVDPVGEKANSYPSLQTQDLNNFRMLIEDHNVEGFIAAVNNNPHHLITSGDTPAILKPPLRYNALHCAVRSGCLEICRSLFKFLEGDEFWTRVYSDDRDDIRRARRCHLIDLYLNTCDKGLQETPLHFACKLGYQDIVSYLLTFTVLDIKARNKFGETAYDIACTKDKGPSDTKKKMIRGLLIAPEKYFVPVLRAVDNSTPPRLSNPCTFNDLKTRQSPILDKKATPVISSAIAGPMSPLQAKTFYKEWRTPSDSVERKESMNVKRSDPDRGLERVGRILAHRQKIQWREYWMFLDLLCDLSKPDGQRALENYLSSLALEGNEGPEGSDEIPLQSPGSPLLQDSDDSSLAEAMESKLSLATPKLIRGHVQQDCTFLTGSEPTKLDYDVMLALSDCDIDLQLYPATSHWLDLIKSYSEEEQKRWRTPRTPCSSTKPPRRFRRDYPASSPQRTHSPSSLHVSSRTPQSRKLNFDDITPPSPL